MLEWDCFYWVSYAVYIWVFGAFWCLLQCISELARSRKFALFSCASNRMLLNRRSTVSALDGAVCKGSALIKYLIKWYIFDIEMLLILRRLFWYIIWYVSFLVVCLNWLNMFARVSRDALWTPRPVRAQSLVARWRSFCSQKAIELGVERKLTS